MAAFVCFLSVGGSNRFKLVNPELIFCILLRSIMFALSLLSLSTLRSLVVIDLWKNMPMKSENKKLQYE